MDTYKNSPEKQFLGLTRYEPVILDSSALMQYKFCPRSYFFRHILGFAPKETPPYFAFGTAYHKFREVLEIGYTNKLSEKDCFKDALIAGLISFESAGQEPKLGSEYDFLTKDRLVQSMHHVYKHWYKEKQDKRITVTATEQPFVLQLPDGTYIAGRIDQPIRWNGKSRIRDFKTSSKDLGNSKTRSYYQRSIAPNDQFTRYMYAASVLQGAGNDLSNPKAIVGDTIVEVLYNTRKSGPELVMFETSRTLGQLQAWLADHSFWTKMLEVSRQNDSYPMNEKNCSFCQFHSVCTLPSESSQLYQLKSNFKIEPWDCISHAQE